MEIITGRLTGNAEIKKIKDGRELTVFTLAANGNYKTKDGEKRDFTNFFQCSYWVNTNAYKVLLKGAIVSLYGHVGINAYETKNHEFRANLTFHVNNFKVIAKGKSESIENIVKPDIGDVKDDLPF